MKSPSSKPCLVIMAAGTGVRFGGLKQFAQVGPNREMLWEYALYDAISLGFQEAVFIIRKEIHDPFERIIKKKVGTKFPVRFVLQEVPDGLKEVRSKPMGTGHALLSAREAVQNPFVIINSDDYYGRQPFQLAISHLLNLQKGEQGFEPLLASYPVENTLSPSGPVNRAVCKVSDSGILASLNEYTGIQQTRKGIQGLNEINEMEQISKGSPVSMNFWLLDPAFFSYLDRDFGAFLDQLENPVSGEYYLPTGIMQASRDFEAPIRVAKTTETWMGLTYQDDLIRVKARLKHLHEEKVYPTPLWK